MQPEISALAERAGQSGVLDDLRFFLNWLESRGKTPWLVTSSSPNGRLDGAMLFYEHRMGPAGLRILASFDETGRRTLLGSRLDPTEFVLDACHALFRAGAQCVLFSFRRDPEPAPLHLNALADLKTPLIWASREKNVADYLPLLETLDDTLAPMGLKTRKHMRYYMRRVAKDLGAEFVPAASLSFDEFMELNNASAYRATEEVARWRYSSFAAARRPLLCGLRDGQGRWLSVIGGLHADDYMELYWQMNRDEPQLKQLSIGTAIRSFLLEHEIERGTKRFYVEGGTSHTMSNAFTQELCTDLVVMRDHTVSRAIPWLVKKYVPKENPLHEFLEHKELVWRKVQR